MAIGIQTTVASEEEARAMAQAALERRLCACVHLEGITSLYRWRGEMCEAREVRLLFKTTRARQAALEALIRQLHSYEVPAVWSVAFDSIAPSYASWIAAETAAGEAGAAPAGDA